MYVFGRGCVGCSAGPWRGAPRGWLDEITIQDNSMAAGMSLCMCLRLCLPRQTAAFKMLHECRATGGKGSMLTVEQTWWGFVTALTSVMAALSSRIPLYANVVYLRGKISNNSAVFSWLRELDHRYAVPAWQRSGCSYSFSNIFFRW